MKPIDEVMQIIDANGVQTGFLIAPSTKKKTDLVECVSAEQFWQLVRENKVKYLVYDETAGCYKAHYTAEELRAIKKSRTASKALNDIGNNLEKFFRDDPSLYAADIMSGKNAFAPVVCKLVMNKLLMCAGVLYLNQPMTDDTIKIINKQAKSKLGNGSTLILKRMYANMLLVTFTLTSDIVNCTYGKVFKNALWFLNGNFGFNMQYLRTSKNLANDAIRLGVSATGTGLPYIDMLESYLEKCKVVGIGW